MNNLMLWDKYNSSSREESIRSLKIKESICIITNIAMEFYDCVLSETTESATFEYWYFDKEKNAYGKNRISMNDADGIYPCEEILKSLVGVYKEVVVLLDTSINIMDFENDIHLSTKSKALDMLLKLYPDSMDFLCCYTAGTTMDDKLYDLLCYIQRRYIMSLHGIEELTQEAATSLLSSDNNGADYAPRGLYLVCSCIDKKPVYCAIDNSTGNGNAFCEDFNTFAECLNYLIGGEITYG